ncbi:MAG: phosphoenolpyruvate carboxylase [Woeseiaceae bacterium]|nr:phosphoenolpyruvate carboxylase [Woeseiaceae bacterium]
MRRQDITFEDKDQALRDDVRTLGRLVGELLTEQGGTALYEFVEEARLRSIRRREGNEKDDERLSDLVSDLDLSLALQVIRASRPTSRWSTRQKRCTASAAAANTCRKSASTSRAAWRKPWSS